MLVAGLVGGTVAASVISSARTALRDQILGTHLVMAEVMAGEMAGYMADMRTDALDLAHRSEVVLALENNDLGSLDTRLAEWLSIRAGKIDGLALYSIDGTLLATVRGNRSLVGQVSVNADAIQRVAASGQPGQGQPLRSRTSGHAILPVYVPARSATGEVIGVFSSTLALEWSSRRRLVCAGWACICRLTTSARAFRRWPI